jgi:hypothetical protein
MKTTKAYIAGIGTTGILVGSIVVLLVLGSGVVAFDGLPDLVQKPAPLDRVVLRDHRPGAGDRSRTAARRQARRAAARRPGRKLGGAPGAGTPGDGGPDGGSPGGGGGPGGGSPGGGSPGGGSPGGGSPGGGSPGGSGGGSPTPPALDDALSGVTDTVVGALEQLAPGAGTPLPELGSQPRDAIH